MSLLQAEPQKHVQSSVTASCDIHGILITTLKDAMPVGKPSRGGTMDTHVAPVTAARKSLPLK